MNAPKISPAHPQRLWLRTYFLMEQLIPFQRTRLMDSNPLLLRAYSYVSPPGLISILPVQLSAPVYRSPQLTIGKIWYECSIISMAPVRKSCSCQRTIYIILSGMCTHPLLSTLTLKSTMEELWPLAAATSNLFLARKIEYMNQHWDWNCWCWRKIYYDTVDVIIHGMSRLWRW